MSNAQHFVFKSSMFLPQPDEDSETNPGLIGKALAAWLAAKLGDSGYDVDGEIAEDFGRLVQLKHSRFGTGRRSDDIQFLAVCFRGSRYQTLLAAKVP